MIESKRDTLLQKLIHNPKEIMKRPKNNSNNQKTRPTEKIIAEKMRLRIKITNKFLKNRTTLGREDEMVRTGTGNVTQFGEKSDMPRRNSSLKNSSENSKFKKNSKRKNGKFNLEEKNPKSEGKTILNNFNSKSGIKFYLKGILLMMASKMGNCQMLNYNCGSDWQSVTSGACLASCSTFTYQSGTNKFCFDSAIQCNIYGKHSLAANSQCFDECSQNTYNAAYYGDGSKCLTAAECKTAKNYVDLDSSRCISASTCIDKGFFLYIDSYTTETGATDNYFCAESCYQTSGHFNGNADNGDAKRYYADLEARECVNLDNCKTRGSILYDIDTTPRTRDCLTKPLCISRGLFVDGDFCKSDCDSKILIKRTGVCVSNCQALNLYYDSTHKECVTQTECAERGFFWTTGATSTENTCGPTCTDKIIVSTGECIATCPSTNLVASSPDRCLTYQECLDLGLMIDYDTTNADQCIHSCEASSLLSVRGSNSCVTIPECATRNGYVYGNYCYSSDECIQEGLYLTNDGTNDICSASCGTTNPYLMEASSRCYDADACRAIEGMLTEDSTKHCISRRDCFHRNRIPTTTQCVSSCPSGSRYRPKFTDCIVESACTGEFLLDSDGILCLSKTECDERGKFYTATNCVYNCPTTGDTHVLYSSKECVDPATQCTTLFKDTTRKFCYTEQECTNEVGWVLDRTALTCSHSCPSSGKIYYKETTNECIDLSGCQGISGYAPLTINSQTGKCILQNHCIELGRWYDEVNDDCVTACPSTLYKNMASNFCQTSCPTYFYADETDANDKKCMTETQCLNSGKYLDIDNRKCINSCSDSSSASEPYVVRETSECLSTTDCAARNYVYFDTTPRKLCMPKIDCVSMGNFLDGDVCVSSCIGRTNSYHNMVTSECIGSVTSSCPNDLYIDSVSSSQQCLTKQMCLDNSMYVEINSGIKTCVSSCSSGFKILSNSRECVADADCTGNMIIDGNYCISKRQCIDSGRVLEGTSCLTVCTTGSNYVLDPLTMICQLKTTCISPYYVLGNDCVTKTECIRRGYYIDEVSGTDHRCGSSCSSGKKIDYESKACVSTCASPKLTKDGSICLSQNSCRQMGLILELGTSSCVASCTTDYILHRGLNQCILKTTCTNGNYVDESNYCVTEKECLDAGLKLDKVTSPNHCYDTCANSATAKYYRPSSFECIVDTSCGSGYYKVTASKLCLTMNQCLERGMFIINKPSNVRECIASCSSDASYQILKRATNECVQTNECGEGFYEDGTLKLCLTAQECRDSGKFVDPESDLCINACSVSSLLLDETTGQCISTANCIKNRFKTTTLCLSRNACLSRNFYLSETDCVDSCASPFPIIHTNGETCVDSCQGIGYKYQGAGYPNDQCLSVETCLSAGGYLFNGSSEDECVQTCSGTTSTFLKKSTSSCTTNAVCIGEGFYLFEPDVGEDMCLSEQECFDIQGYIDGTTCTLACSGSNLLLRSERKCYSENDCTNLSSNHYKDTVAKTCVTKNECIERGKFVIPDEKKCVVNCASQATNNFLKTSTNECIIETDCGDGFYQDQTGGTVKLCVTTSECIDLNRVYYTQTDGTRVCDTACEADDTAQIAFIERENRCVSKTYCYTIGYYDDTNKLCLTRDQCLEIGYLVESDSSAATAFKLCKTSCSFSPYLYRDELRKKCFSGKQCSDVGIIDDSNRECLSSLKCTVEQLRAINPCLSTDTTPCPATGETLTGAIQCVDECPGIGNGDSALKVTTRECIDPDECHSGFYLNEDNYECISRESCLALGKLVMPKIGTTGPNKCVSGCPEVVSGSDTIQTYLVPSTSECIKEADCAGSRYKYDNGDTANPLYICYTQKECIESSKLIIAGTSKSCVDNCPTTPDTAAIYFKDITFECVSATDCTGSFNLDTTNNFCIQNNFCLESGRFKVEATNECVSKCSGTYNYLLPSTNECIKESDCVDPLFQEQLTNPSCLTQKQCLDKNKFLVFGTPNQCVTSCSNSGLFLIQSSNECVSETNCDDRRMYVDKINSLCLTKEECLQLGYHYKTADPECVASCGTDIIDSLTGECIASCPQPKVTYTVATKVYCVTVFECKTSGKLVKPSDDTCISSCDPSDFYHAASKTCLTTQECSGGDFFQQDSNCLTKAECIDSGKYPNFEDSTCVSSCGTTANTYFDRESGTCVGCAGSNQQYKLETSPKLCINKEECFNLGNYLGNGFCVPSCSDANVGDRNYLKVSNGECVNVAGCDGTFVVDEVRALCLTEKECLGDGYLLDFSDGGRKCVENCPTTTGEAEYFKTSTFECVKGVDCTGSFYKDDEGIKTCVSKSECIGSGRFIIINTQQCVTECPRASAADPKYLKVTQSECVVEADCKGIYYKDEETPTRFTCVSKFECNKNNKVVDETEKKCVSSCETDTAVSLAIYYHEDSKTCYSEVDCQKGLLTLEAVGKKFCVSDAKCNSDGYLVSPSSNTCVSVCPATGDIYQSEDGKQCLTENICKANGYIEDDTKSCLTQSTCNSRNRMIIRAERSCVVTCPTDTDGYNFKTENDVECIKATTCYNIGFADTEQAMCVSRSSCLNSGRYIEIIDGSPTTNKCVSSCSGALDHLKQLSGECIDSADCKDNFFKVEYLGTKLCLSDSECFAIQGYLDRANWNCLLSCPVTSGDARTYFLETTGECLEEAECTDTRGNLFVDDENNRCVSLEQCRKLGKFTVPDTNKCVATCTTNEPYLKESQAECIVEADCDGAFYTYASTTEGNKCLIRSECLAKGFYYVESSKDCVESCPNAQTTDAKYLVEQKGECLTATDCFSLGYVDETRERCVTRDNCLLENRFITAYVDTTPVKYCLPSCPTTGTDIYSYETETTKECISLEECLNIGIVDKTDNTCIRKQDCLDKNFYITPCDATCLGSVTFAGSPKQCTSTCPTTGANSLKIATSECVDPDECVGGFYQDNELNQCVTRTQCLEAGKYIFDLSGKSYCVGSCGDITIGATTTSTTLKVSSSECILDTDCTGSLFTYTNTEGGNVIYRCYTEKECIDDGKLLIMAENLCVDNCPTTPDTAAILLKDLTKECVKKADCINSFSIDEPNNLCSLLSECEGSGNFRVEGTNECVSICPATYPYLRPITKECIEQADCVAPYFQEQLTTNPNCLSSKECLDKNKFLVVAEAANTPNECVVTCSGEGLLLVESTGECISEAKCITRNQYVDATNSICLSREECISQGYYFDSSYNCDDNCGSNFIRLNTSECIPVADCTVPLVQDTESEDVCLSVDECLDSGKFFVPSDLTCVSSCPAAAPFFREKTRRCLTSAECGGSLFEESTNRCVDRTECIDEGKFLDVPNGLCTATCTGARPYIDLDKGECVPCEDNKLKADSLTPQLCLTVNECLTRGDYFANTDGGHCVTDCSTAPNSFSFLKRSTGECILSTSCNGLFFSDTTRSLCLTDVECISEGNTIIIDGTTRTCEALCPTAANGANYILEGTNQCIKAIECLGGLYKDDGGSSSAKICRSKSSCIAAGKYAVDSDNTCVQICSDSASGEDYLKVSLSECVTDAQCTSLFYKDEEDATDLLCITKKECNDKGKLVVETATSNDCITACPTALADDPKFITEDLKSCLTADVCKMTGFLYEFDSVYRCLSKETCLSLGNFVNQDLRTCSKACPPTGQTLKTENGQECLTEETCKKTSYVDQERQLCISKKKCKEDSRFIIESDRTCVTSCPTDASAEIYLKESVSECILESECVGNFYKLETLESKLLCVSAEECKAKSRILINKDTENICVAYCPYDADYIYHLEATQNCLTTEQCSSFLYRDDYDNKCYTHDQCVDAGKVYVQSLNYCAFNCPDTHEFLYKKLQECMDADKCVGSLFKNLNNKMCYTRQECLNAGFYIVPETNDCVDSCTKADSDYKYLNEDEGRCVKHEICKLSGRLSVDATNRCITRDECASSFRFRTGQGFCVTSCSEVPLEPLINFDNTMCIDEATCRLEDGYVDNDDSKCKTDTGCLRGGKLLSRQRQECVDACYQTGTPLEKYIKKSQRVCLTAEECARDGFIYESAVSECFSEVQCINSERNIIDDTSTCVDSCTDSGTHTYLKPLTGRCLTPTQCTDYKVDTVTPPLCVTEVECKTSSLTVFLTEAPGSCISYGECSTLSKYVYPSRGTCEDTCEAGLFTLNPGKLCLTESECTQQNYIDRAAGTCIEECTGTMFTIESNKECVADCGDLVKQVSDRQCLLSSTECLERDPANLYIPKDNECSQTCPYFKYLPTSECLENCPDQVDEVTKECYAEVTVSAQSLEGISGQGTEDGPAASDKTLLIQENRQTGKRIIEKSINVGVDLTANQFEELVQDVRLTIEQEGATSASDARLLQDQIVDYTVIKDVGNPGLFIIRFETTILDRFRIIVAFDREKTILINVGDDGAQQNIRIGVSSISFIVPGYSPYLRETETTSGPRDRLLGMIYDCFIKVMALMGPSVIQNPFVNYFAFMSQTFDRYIVIKYSSIGMSRDARNQYIDLYSGALPQIGELFLGQATIDEEVNYTCGNEKYLLWCTYKSVTNYIYFLVGYMIFLISSLFVNFIFKSSSNSEEQDKKKKDSRKLAYADEKKKDEENQDSKKKSSEGKSSRVRIQEDEEDKMEDIDGYQDNSESRKRFQLHISKENPNYKYQSHRSKKVVNIAQISDGEDNDDDDNFGKEYDQELRKLGSYASSVKKHSKTMKIRQKNDMIEEERINQGMDELDFIRNKTNGIGKKIRQDALKDIKEFMRVDHDEYDAGNGDKNQKLFGSSKNSQDGIKLDVRKDLRRKGKKLKSKERKRRRLKNKVTPLMLSILTSTINSWIATQPSATFFIIATIIVGLLTLLPFIMAFLVAIIVVIIQFTTFGYYYLSDQRRSTKYNRILSEKVYSYLLLNKHNNMGLFFAMTYASDVIIAVVIILVPQSTIAQAFAIGGLALFQLGYIINRKTIMVRFFFIRTCFQQLLMLVMAIVIAMSGSGEEPGSTADLLGILLPGISIVVDVITSGILFGLIIRQSKKPKEFWEKWRADKVYKPGERRKNY